MVNVYAKLMEFIEGISNEAVGNKATILYEPIKQNQKLVCIQGNGSITFKVKVARRNCIGALKVFIHDNSYDVHEFAKVVHKVNNLISPHVIYLEQFTPFCRLCGDDYEFPLSAILTDWVSGKSFEDIIIKSVETKQTVLIGPLLKGCEKLITFFIKNKITNVDLKLSKFMLDDQGEVKILDYKGWKIGAKVDGIDYLKLWVYLKALEEDLSLFQKFGKRDLFFFSRSDFERPRESKLFNELRKYNKLKPLISCLVYYDFHKDEEIDFDEIFNERFLEPEIVISQYPEEAYCGEPIQLSWLSFDADTVLIDEVAFKNKYVIDNSQPDQIVKFDLVNKFAEREVLYNLNIWGDPNINLFNVDKIDIEFGEAIKIEWDCSYSKKVTLFINDHERIIEPKGFLNLRVKEALAIYIKVSGIQRQVKISELIKVNVYKPVSILSFWTDLPFIISGSSVELHWNVANCESVTLVSNEGLEIEVTNRDFYCITELVRTAKFHLLAENKLFKEESPWLTIETICVSDYPKPKFLD